MPNGEEACPACEAKIIVNGDVTARVLDATCESIDRFLAGGGVFAHPRKLVEMANKLEDDAFKFQREVLAQQGFVGPWPHSLS